MIVAAFEGWNDAGDAATTAVGHLRDRWDAEPLADIDAEAFYDFTQARPNVVLDDDGGREIEWPRNSLWSATVPGLGDVVLVEGTEPALAWRTFCRQVLHVAEQYDARMLVTLGALISDVAHSRPVELYGLGHDVDLGPLGVEGSTYEGPTGIVGVLHAACRERELPSASLWAAVPSYVHGSPSPKAALALLRTVGNLLGVGIPLTDLEIATAAYERQVDQLVAEDEDTADMVRRLEERHDELADPAALVAEVEKFLRDRTDD